jgi:hypothetical protein
VSIDRLIIQLSRRATSGSGSTVVKLTIFSSYSKLLAFEVCRILWRLGCDVRVYDPSGLPMKDDVQQTHPKVQELRDLSRWSDGHFWVSPEQHGNLVWTHLSLPFMSQRR